MATTLDGAKNDFTGEATLGLYGARQEVAALREVLEATQAMRAQVTENKAEGEGESGEAAGDSIEVD
jgi:hypothetical protein